ncbi:chemotaxis protein CheW [Hahella ganghwensis]|uniref:chemotaxis protein CheW n=1 Tax=Hahella ganghwensis TaxID=286420 RepID=UPI00037F4AE1|nr:chemotaxis protein CheW [Hahella ganghwensis]
MQDVKDVQLLRFSLDKQSYAIELDCIRKVLRTVAISPFPQAPSVICGMINVHGLILPVVDLRPKFGLPARSPQMEDRLIWANANGLDLALVVDQVSDVISIPFTTPVDSSALISSPSLLKGIVPLPDGVLLIHDLKALLDQEEQKELADAMSDD